MRSGTSIRRERSRSCSAPICRPTSSWCDVSPGSPDLKHILKLNDVILGHSQLEEVDALDRRVWGQFHPGFGYELVQPIFRLFSEATPMPGGEPRDEIKLARYFAARDQLPLRLEDDRGRAIKTAAIHIADYSLERGPDAISLDVLVPDDAYWERRV